MHATPKELAFRSRWVTKRPVWSERSPDSGKKLVLRRWPGSGLVQTELLIAWPADAEHEVR